MTETQNRMFSAKKRKREKCIRNGYNFVGLFPWFFLKVAPKVSRKSYCHVNISKLVDLSALYLFLDGGTNFKHPASFTTTPTLLFCNVVFSYSCWFWPSTLTIFCAASFAILNLTTHACLLLAGSSKVWNLC